MPHGPRPHELVLVHEIHPNAYRAVRRAVRNLFDQKLGERDVASAMDIIDSFIAGMEFQTDSHKWSAEAWLNWKTMLNLVRDIAVADPKYHGITDPINERYCSGCRKVRPVKDFTNHHLRCDNCEDKRKCPSTSGDARLKSARSGSSS